MTEHLGFLKLAQITRVSSLTRFAAVADAPSVELSPPAGEYSIGAVFEIGKLGPTLQ